MASNELVSTVCTPTVLGKRKQEHSLGTS